jgi:hypothetical protein
VAEADTQLCGDLPRNAALHSVEQPAQLSLDDRLPVVEQTAHRLEHMSDFSQSTWI